MISKLSFATLVLAFAFSCDAAPLKGTPESARDGSAGRLLVLHGWRTRADLDAYNATVERAVVTALASNGTSVERFTGEIVAQYSWLNG